MIRNGLDHTHRYDHYRGNQQSHEQRPYWQFRRPDFDNDDGKYEGEDEQYTVPPSWNGGVLGHESGVDIGVTIFERCWRG